MRGFVFLFGLATTLIAGVAAIGDCDSGPWGSPMAIGDIHDDSKSDVEICETQWKQGRVVSGIEVWATKKNLAGIQLTYSNGDLSNMIGTAEGDHHQKLNWDPKLDTVEELHMWSNPEATRLGKIYIKLSNGNTLDVGMDKPAATTWYMDRFSGIMLGAYGRADSAITAWGFLFLEDSVAKISLSDFKFDEDPETFASQQKGITKQVFATESIYNTASNATTVDFGLHYELEISAQVAGIGPKLSGGWEFTVGMENKKEWSKTDRQDLIFKVNQLAVPGKTTVCVGYADVGRFDGEYEANVHITLRNGKTFDFRERGHRNQVMFGGSEDRCADKEGNHLDVSPLQFVESVQNPQKRDLGKFISTPFVA